MLIFSLVFLDIQWWLFLLIIWSGKALVCVFVCASLLTGTRSVITTSRYWLAEYEKRLCSTTLKRYILMPIHTWCNNNVQKRNRWKGQIQLFQLKYGACQRGGTIHHNKRLTVHIVIHLRTIFCLKTSKLPGIFFIYPNVTKCNCMTLKYTQIHVAVDQYFIAGIYIAIHQFLPLCHLSCHVYTFLLCKPEEWNWHNANNNNINKYIPEVVVKVEVRR